MPPQNIASTLLVSPSNSSNRFLTGIIIVGRRINDGSLQNFRYLSFPLAEETAGSVLGGLFANRVPIENAISCNRVASSVSAAMRPTGPDINTNNMHRVDPCFKSAKGMNQLGIIGVFLKSAGEIGVAALMLATNYTIHIVLARAILNRMFRIGFKLVRFDEEGRSPRLLKRACVRDQTTSKKNGVLEIFATRTNKFGGGLVARLRASQAWAIAQIPREAFS